jgi:uncharacterized protein YoxC
VVLLLTVLSVLAVWAFLTLLVVGLLVILKALDGVRRNMEQIAMGVRAIEHQTAPIGTRAVTLGGSIEAVTGVLDELAQALDHTGGQLAGPAPGNRPH